MLLTLFGCEEDDQRASYTIINNGSAGTSAIDDLDDNEPLAVAQAVPSVSNTTYPKDITIMFFLNDKVYLNSIKENFIVKVNEVIVGGTLYINEASNGFAILTFIPSTEFKAGQEVEVIIKSTMQDDGGNGFLSDFVLTFMTSSGSSAYFDSNKSFESDDQGILFIGDGAVLSGNHGSVGPTNGQKFGAITTGTKLISSGSAIGGASSMMILGPINKGLSSFKFDYNFISSEFNDYVGSIYDDCVIVTISGPNGAYSKMLTSVNTIGNNNSQCYNFAGLPDQGDSYAGYTNWISSSLSFSNVGNPAFIIFTVTDVSDEIYSSALVIDNVIF
jgi:hypothetical protein